MTSAGKRPSKNKKKKHQKLSTETNSDACLSPANAHEDYQKLHTGEKVFSATHKYTGCCIMFTQELHHEAGM